MEIGDLVQDISGTEMAISGTVGFIVGAIFGAVDKSRDKNRLEHADMAASTTSGLCSTRFDGTMTSNLAEATVNVLAARIGYEIGYQATQRIIYNNY